MIYWNGTLIAVYFLCAYPHCALDIAMVATRALAFAALIVLAYAVAGRGMRTNRYNVRPLEERLYDKAENACGSDTVTFGTIPPDGSWDGHAWPWEMACNWHDACYAAHLPKEYCDSEFGKAVHAMAEDGVGALPAGFWSYLAQKIVELSADSAYASSFSAEDRAACSIGDNKPSIPCLEYYAAVDKESFPKAPIRALHPANKRAVLERSHA
jgi:hypothetical protein